MRLKALLNGVKGKGKVTEKTGQVTNNPDLEAEGKAESDAGKVDKKSGRN